MSGRRLGEEEAGPVAGRTPGPEVLVSMQGPYTLSAQIFPPELLQGADTKTGGRGGGGGKPLYEEVCLLQNGRYFLHFHFLASLGFGAGGGGGLQSLWASWESCRCPMWGFIPLMRNLCRCKEDNPNHMSLGSKRNHK